MKKIALLFSAFSLSACQTTSEISWGSYSGTHKFTDEHICFVAPEYLVHSSRGTSSIGFFPGELVPYAKFTEGKVEAGVTFDRSRAGQAVGNIELRVDNGPILKLMPIAAHQNELPMGQLANNPYADLMKSSMQQSQQIMLAAMAKKAGYTKGMGIGLVKKWLQGTKIRYRQVSVVGESNTGEFSLAGFKEQFSKCSDKAIGQDLAEFRKQF